MSDTGIDNDIKKRLKSGKAGVFSYTSNMTKSFLHMGKYMVSSEMPTLFGYAEVNKDIIDETYQAIKNPRKAFGAKYNQMTAKGEIAEVKKVWKYILDDIKSGKFYDENRDRTNIGLETEAMLNDFGGVDFSDYGSDEFSAADSSEDREFELDLAQVQENNADSRASTTISAMGSMTNAIIDNDNANHDFDIKTRMKQHDQAMTGLSNIAMTNSANYEMSSSAFSEMLNLSRDANNEILSKMDNITSILSEIRDQNKKIEINSTASLTNKIDDLPIKNGVLDVKKYISFVKKNINNKYDVTGKISMLTQGMEIKDLIELYKSNPIGGLITTAIRGLSPKDFYKDLKGFDNSLRAFLPSALMKVGGMKNKDGEDSLLQVLGLKNRPYGSIKTEYNMGKVDYTGKSDKALTEVIPLLLGSINSAIRGEPLKVYDYASGRFIEARGKLANIERDLGKHSNSIDVKSRVFDNMQYVNSDLVDTRKKKNDFQESVSKFFDTMVDKQELLNLYDIDKERNQSKLRDKAITVFGGGNSLEKMNLLIGLIRSLDRKDLIAMPGNVMMRGLEHEGRLANTQKNLNNSGLLSLYSDIDADVTNFASKTKDNLYLSNEDIADTIDKSKKLTIPSMMKDIRDILRRGVITYSYGIGQASGEDVSRMLNSVILPDQKETLKGIEDVIKNDRAKAESKTRSGNELLSPYSKAIGFSAEAPAALIAKLVREARQADELREEDDVLKNMFGDLFSEKTRTNVKNLKDVIAVPFNGITKTLNSTEEMMYKFLYGEEYGEIIASRSGKSGLFNTLSTFFTGLFTKSEKIVKDVVGKKVVDPISDYLFNKDNGKITSLISNKINPLIEKGKNKANDFLFGKAGLVDRYDEDGNPIYKKNENGSVEYTMDEWGELVPVIDQESVRSGGMLSSFMNRGKTYKNAIMAKAGEYKDKALGQGRGLFAKLNDYFFGKEIDEETGEKKGLFGRMSQSIKSSFDNFSKWLFGEDEDGQPSDSRKKFGEVKEEFGKAFPDMAMQGVIGAGAVTGVGMLTGLFLPGGPILGAIIGSVTGLVTGSEKVRDFVFGENGIDESVVEGFKKYAPKIGIGGLVGATLGTFGLLPFGLGSMGGAVMGSLGGMIAASDDLKEILFGSSDDADSGLFSKNNREAFFKKVLPTGLLAGGGATILSTALASGIGIFPAIPFLPHGPIVGMVAGLSAAFSADSIKDFFFGDGSEKDENGKPTGKYNSDKRGMFIKLFDTTRDHLFQPMLDGINNTGKSISNWFKEGIVDQMRGAMQPMKDEMAKARDSIRSALHNMGDGIKGALTSVFEKSLGMPLNDFMKEHIYDPLRKHTSALMKVLGRVIGGVISAPFRLINLMFNKDGSVMDTINGRKDEEREKAFQDRQEKRKKKIEEARAKRALAKMSPDDRADLRTKTISDRMGGLKAALLDIKNAILGTPTDLASDAESSEAVDKSSKKAEKKQEKALRTKMKHEARIKSREEKKKNKEDKRKFREEARLKKMEQIDAKREESNKKKKGKNSPEKNLSNISHYTEKMSKFLESNISGIGYDVRYIRNMLLKQHGTLDEGMLPENSPANGKVPKRYSKLARVGSWISDKAFGFKNGAIDLFDKAKGVLGYVMTPFRLIKDAASTIASGMMEFFEETKHMFWGALDSIFHTIKTGFDSAITLVGDSLKTLTGVVAGAARGIGEGIGSIVKELGGALGGLVGVFTGLTTGLAEFTKTVAPEIGRGLGTFIVGGTKMAIKGAGKILKAGGKLVGGAAKGIFNFVTGKGKNTHEETVINNVNGAYIVGGTLDSINNAEFLMKTGVYGSNMIVTLKQVAMLGSIAVGKSPKYALPVYIAGNYSDQPDFLKNRRAQYRKYNRMVSNNDGKNTRTLYDNLYERTENQSDIDVLENVFTLNSAGSLRTASSATSGNSEVSDDGNEGSVAGSVLGGIFGSMGLRSLFKTPIKAAKAIITRVTGLVGAMLPTLIPGAAMVYGTKNAIDEGNIGQASENIGRATYGIGRGLMSNPMVKEAVGNSKIGKGILSGAGKLATKTGVSNILTRTAEGALRIASPANGTGLLAKVVKLLNGAITKFFALKQIKNKLGAKVASKLAGTIIAKFGKWLSSTVIARMGAKLVTFLGGPAVVTVFAVADFTTGMAGAANIFGVLGSQVDTKMRLTAGVAKAISGLTFGIIDPNSIAELVYPFIASDEEEKELGQAQSALAALATEAGMSAEDFNKNVQNRTVFKKVTDWFKDTFTDNKSDYYKYKNSIIDTENGNGRGKGIGKYFTQTDPKWNTGTAKKYQIDKAGCGPTVAAMMVNGTGTGSDPVEASKLSMEFGDRDPDGGTNPRFFEKYGAYHGKNLKQGPVNQDLIRQTLSSGGKVALMGKDDGDVYGRNMHYIMGDGIDSAGNVRIVDPLKKSPKKASIKSVVSNAKSAVYGKGIGDIVSGFFDSFSSGIDKAISARFGLPIQTSAESSSMSTSAGTAYNMSLGTSSKDKILQKLFEIICNTEGGADGYYAVANDVNANSGKIIGPSIGIMQWHASRISAIMKPMYEKLPDNDIAKKWSQYNWGNDVPLGESDLSEIRNFLKNNVSVAKVVQNSVAMIELQTTLLDRIYSDGRLTDPRAIILLADIGNTGPARIVPAIDSHFAKGGKNTVDSLYRYLTTNSFWATCGALAKGYKNRITRVYNILKQWTPPSNAVADIKKWFLNNIPGSKVTQEFGANPNNGYNKAEGHRGIDFGAPSGTNIPSPIDGSVTLNNYEADGFGNYIKIKDNNNMTHIFGHMRSRSSLAIGNKVSVGDSVGLIGSTGTSTGPHLHYEIRDANSKSYNPSDYFSSNGISYGPYENTNPTIMNLGENGKGENSNNMYDLVKSTNKRIKNTKNDIEFGKGIEELSKKIDTIKETNDNNGKGSGDSSLLENIGNILTKMVNVLETIEKNTRNDNSAEVNVNNTRINNDRDMPKAKPTKDKSVTSGTYAIDMITAK